MVMIRRGACAAFAAAAALILSGCVAPAPAPQPDPEPTNTPIFATDEEALAAAEAAYGEYLAISDLILQQHGLNPERLKPLVSEDWYQVELEGINKLVDSGKYQTGAAGFDSLDLQQAVQDPGGSVVVVYLCVDLSNMSILDADGLDHAPEASRFAMQVTFETSAPNMPLLISGQEPWSSSKSC